MNPAIAGRPSLVEGTYAAAVPGHDPPQRERRAQHRRTGRTRSPPRSSSPRAAPTARSSRRAAAPAAGAFSRTRASSAYHYNFCGLSRRPSRPTQPLAAGTHQVRAEFAYDGGGIGQGGDVTLYVDGTRPAAAASSARIRCTSRSTRGSTSGWTPACRCSRATRRPRAAFTGTHRLGPRSTSATTTTATSSTPRSGSSLAMRPSSVRPGWSGIHGPGRGPSKETRAPTDSHREMARRSAQLSRSRTWPTRER